MTQMERDAISYATNPNEKKICFVFSRKESRRMSGSISYDLSHTFRWVRVENDSNGENSNRFKIQQEREEVMEAVLNEAAMTGGVEEWTTPFL